MDNTEIHVNSNLNMGYASHRMLVACARWAAAALYLQLYRFLGYLQVLQSKGELNDLLAFKTKLDDDFALFSSYSIWRRSGY